MNNLVEVSGTILLMKENNVVCGTRKMMILMLSLGDAMIPDLESGDLGLNSGSTISSWMAFDLFPNLTTFTLHIYKNDLLIYMAVVNWRLDNTWESAL